MNLYGNKAGVHSPERTFKTLTYLEEKTSLEILDVSWHNDLVDSLEIEKHDLHIFLPNSDTEDSSNELFDTFTITLASKYGEGDEHLLQTTKIDEVVDYLNQLN